MSSLMGLWPLCCLVEEASVCDDYDDYDGPRQNSSGARVNRKSTIKTKKNAKKKKTLYKKKLEREEQEKKLGEQKPAGVSMSASIKSEAKEMYNKTAHDHKNGSKTENSSELKKTQKDKDKDKKQSSSGHKDQFSNSLHKDEDDDDDNYEDIDYDGVFVKHEIDDDEYEDDDDEDDDDDDTNERIMLQYFLNAMQQGMIGEEDEMKEEMRRRKLRDKKKRNKANKKHRTKSDLGLGSSNISGSSNPTPPAGVESNLHAAAMPIQPPSAEIRSNKSKALNEAAADSQSKPNISTTRKSYKSNGDNDNGDDSDNDNDDNDGDDTNSNEVVDSKGKPLKIGNRVTTVTKVTGTIAFVGRVHYSKGVFVGLVVDHPPHGKNNGESTVCILQYNLYIINTHTCYVIVVLFLT